MTERLTPRELFEFLHLLRVKYLNGCDPLDKEQYAETMARCIRWMDAVLPPECPF
jgi:hypothetical protein